MVFSQDIALRLFSPSSFSLSGLISTGDEGGGGGKGGMRGFLVCVCVCLISKMTFSTTSCKMYSPHIPCYRQEH